MTTEDPGGTAAPPSQARGERASRLNRAVRTANKHVLNPLMLRLAGRRSFYAARVEHVGRRSGRPRATPAVARPVPGGFALPLPYGQDVDWRLNLVAAGGGSLVADGVRYRITDPRTVPAAEVLPSLDPRWTRLLRRIPVFVVVRAEPA